MVDTGNLVWTRVDYFSAYNRHFNRYFLESAYFNLVGIVGKHGEVCKFAFFYCAFFLFFAGCLGGVDGVHLECFVNC